MSAMTEKVDAASRAGDAALAFLQGAGAVPKPLPLALRIANAQKEVHTVEKKGDNQGQGYKYAREIDVVQMARDLLLKHGVIVIPSVPRVEFRAVPTRSGQSNLTDVYPVFTVKATDTDESLDCAWYGCGADTTDKGGNKAITASLKYFLIKLLLIPTGDADPDADSEQDVSIKPGKPKPTLAGVEPGAEPPAPTDEEKVTARRREVIGVAMELSDKTKEPVDAVLKKASGFDNEKTKKHQAFDGRTIGQVTSVAWLDRTLSKLLDQLAKAGEAAPF